MQNWLVRPMKDLGASGQGRATEVVAASSTGWPIQHWGESETLLLKHIKTMPTNSRGQEEGNRRCEQGQRHSVVEEKRVSPLSRVGESQDGEEHGRAQFLTEGKMSLEVKVFYHQLRFPSPVFPPAQGESSTSISK